MQLVDRLGELPRSPVTIELDDIQATVLRYRPEPYYGTHVMLHVDDAHAGREFVRRLTPHVDSAADWWRAGQAWTSIAISYAGVSIRSSRRSTGGWMPAGAGRRR
jgi:deferrochelatase/peroxidase EfeB